MTDINQIAITSPDGRLERLEQLRRLLPDLFDGEGQLNEKVLRALISDEVGVAAERFTFEWAGKQKSKRFAFSPSKATLQFDAKRSLNRDGSPNKAGETLGDNTSENLIIEGDNLEVLKLLQTTYFEQVKCIYIDPPYNTGNDFIYPDDYSQTRKNYWESNSTIKSGVRLKAVTETSGRRHSEWLNFMQSRLLIAKNTLRRDGVIFVSIGDAEVANLRKLMDEIFGGDNFEGHIHWRRRHNQPNDKTKMLGIVAEHILVYAKDKPFYKETGVGKIELTGNFSNPDDDLRGDWASKPWKVGSDQSGSSYKIELPSGETIDGEWMGEESTYRSLLADKRIVFSNNGKSLPRKKYFKFEREAEGQCATNWWSHDQFGHNQAGNNEMTELFGEKNIFSNPKPTQLIQNILSIANVKAGDTVIDFFAGSGTICQACYIYDEKVRFIAIQVPEKIEESEEAYKNGYKTISQITIERAKRSGLRIQETNPDANIDTGFRVFKLTDSNFPQNLFSPDPAKSEEENLKALEAHLAKATQMRLFDEDEFSNLVTEISLKNGFGLFYELKPVDGLSKNKVYRLVGNDKSTLLCLDNYLHDETVEGLKPLKDEQLTVSKFSLDTTKKFSLQTEFKDNLWVV